MSAGGSAQVPEGGRSTASFKVPDSVGTRVFTIDEARAMTSVLGSLLRPPPPPASERCMGKRCARRAEFEVAVIDQGKAAHADPVRLCEACLTALDGDTGRPVDIFRWLSNNRIEADR